MVELRHSSSIGSRATSSPMKRDDVSSPLFPDSQPNDDDDHDRHASKDRDRPSWYNFQSLCPFFSDDARVSPYNSRISLFFIFVIVLAGAISVFSIVNRLVSTLIPWCSAFRNSICRAMTLSVFPRPLLVFCCSENVENKNPMKFKQSDSSEDNYWIRHYWVVF